MSSETAGAAPPQIPAAGAASAASPETPAPAAAAPIEVTPPPITFDFLAQNMRKHVDPKAPVPLRMMAAKALVPLNPPDMLSALFMLTYDPDASVRETAGKTAGALPDKMLAVALRDEGLQPPVLGYFMRLFGEREVYAEMLILNGTTPDEDIAVFASRCSLKLAEIIGQNQLRLLRHEDLVRQLCLNGKATASLLDSVCDFAVRSGLKLMDVPQMRDARIRLFGVDAADTPPSDGPTADEVMSEYAELADTGGSAPPLEEGKRLTISQRVLKMSVSEKIKLATKGNKEARGLLIRDSNKLVALAVIRSPRITDGEVLSIANNRAAQEDVLRVVYNNREWLKSYPLKLALVKNPKVPVAISMRFLGTLRESEVKDLARNKNVSSGIQMMAKKMMDKKNAPKKEEK